MLTWVTPFIWASLGALANALQLIGLLGVIGGGAIGIMSITNKILEEAEHEDELQ